MRSCEQNNERKEIERVKVRVREKSGVYKCERGGIYRTPPV